MALPASPKVPARLAAFPDRRTFLRQSGLNLPWISYGHDVGWPMLPGQSRFLGFRHMTGLLGQKTRLPSDMKAYRVWMLGDDRAGSLSPMPRDGFTGRCIKDMDAFMRATPDDTVVIWTIYDFMIGDGAGTPWGGTHGEHLELVHDSKGWHRAFSTIRPCISAMQRKWGHRIIWDVMNEPLNGSRLITKDVDLDLLKGFLYHHMDRLLLMGGRVTLGARSVEAVRHVFGDLLRKVDARRKTLGLKADHLVVQLHHYPGAECHAASSLATTTAKRLRAELKLDPQTPVLLGEAWPDSGFTLSDYHVMGFAGALFWQDSDLGPAGRKAGKQASALRSGSFVRRRPFVPHRREHPRAAEPMGAVPTLPVLIQPARCRILAEGAPWERPWLARVGCRTEAFSRAYGSSKGSNRGLLLEMDVEASPDFLRSPYTRQSKRKGEVICPLSKDSVSRVYDLRGTEIEIALVPPIESVSNAWGSGVQLLLQDSSGRRLHSAWTSFSPVSGGRIHRLRFRPLTSAVPGMGFRHQGFDLTRVRYVGFLWACGTFSSTRFRGRMALSSLTIRKARGRQAFFHESPSPQVLRPLKKTTLASCRFHRQFFAYAEGLSGPTGPYPGTSPARSFAVRMDGDDPHRQSGLVLTDLATGCPRMKGRLLDVAGMTFTARVEVTPSGLPLSYQVVFVDQKGTACYARNAADVSKPQTIKLRYGPEICSHGAGIDLGRIRKAGVKLFLEAGKGRSARGSLRILEMTMTP